MNHGFLTSQFGEVSALISYSRSFSPSRLIFQKGSNECLHSSALSEWPLFVPRLLSTTRRRAKECAPDSLRICPQMAWNSPAATPPSSTLVFSEVIFGVFSWIPVTLGAGGWIVGESNVNSWTGRINPRRDIPEMPDLPISSRTPTQKTRSSTKDGQRRDNHYLRRHHRDQFPGIALDLCQHPSKKILRWGTRTSIGYSDHHCWLHWFSLIWL